MSHISSLGLPKDTPNHRRTQPPQRTIALIALGSFIIGTISLSRYGWQQSALFLIGGLFGITLYRSSFEFASAYRKLLVRREVDGIYAQLVMLGLATVLFAPVLAAGTIGC